MPLCDTIVAAIVVGVIWSSALALGATHAWVFVPLEIAIFTFSVPPLSRLRGSQLAPSSVFRGPVGAVVTPLFAFLLWTGFQTVPLPPSFLRIIAPASYKLYQQVLPNWPGEVPYSTAPRPSSLRPRNPEILPTVAEAAQGAAIPFQAIDHQPGAVVEPAPAGSFSIDALRWRSLSLAPSASRRAWLMFAACAALFLMIALYPFGVGEGRQGANRDFMRLFFKALVLIAMVEGLVGVWGSVSSNRMILHLFHPLEWPRLPWGSRATGTFANSDHFAFFLNLVFPACLLGVIVPGAFVSRVNQNAYRLFCATASVLVAAALVLSGSRGGWTSALIGVVFLMHLLSRGDSGRTGFFRSRRWIAAGAIVVIFLLADLSFVGTEGHGMVHARLRPGAGEITWRMTPTIDSLPMLARFPLFGIGLGAWPDLFRGYKRAPWSEVFYNAAHDDWLQLTAETGIIGAALLALALIAAGRRLRQGFQSAANDELVYMAAVGATLPGAALHELIDFSLQTPANAILLSALLGVGMRIGWKRVAPGLPRSDDLSARRVIMQLTVVAALSLAIVAACQDKRDPHPYDLRITASIAEVRKALLRHPSDSRVHYLLAEKMRRAMLADLESQELLTTLYLEPANPHARDRYAQVLVERGQVSEALREITLSVYYAPSFSPHAYLSERLIGWLSPDERRAILIGLHRAASEKFAGAALALGAFYSAIGQARPSATAYLQAAAREAIPGERVRCWVLAARAFSAAGEFDPAAIALRDAIRTDGRQSEPYQLMITAILAPAAKFAEARRLIAQGLGNGADPAGLYLALAEAEESQARRADAEADLLKAVELEPASFACLQRLGRLYLADGKYDDAIRWLRKAAEVRPESSEVFFFLALAQDGAYDYTSADGSYARAIALAPSNLEFRVRYRDFQQRMADNIRIPARIQ